MKNKTREEKELAQNIVGLWNKYRRDEDVLNNTNLIPGWPVISGSGFLQWLKENYEK